MDNDPILDQMTLRLATYDNAIAGLQTQRDAVQAQIDAHLNPPTVDEVETDIQSQIEKLQSQLIAIQITKQSGVQSAPGN